MGVSSVDCVRRRLLLRLIPSGVAEVQRTWNAMLINSYIGVRSFGPRFTLFEAIVHSASPSSMFICRNTDSVTRELRRLFETVRSLVEKRYWSENTPQDFNRELPWQSVSAFCFLRFIVPAILHPHLFGLCSGPCAASIRYASSHKLQDFQTQLYNVASH